MKKQLVSKLKKRFCLNCDRPIGGDDHATRLFCEKWYDSAGKVHDCKTTYHRDHDKPDRERYSEFINNHKAITARIIRLTEKKGNEVSTDDLVAYDIHVKECITYDISPAGFLVSNFLKHQIISSPISEKHKIIANG